MKTFLKKNVFFSSSIQRKDVTCFRDFLLTGRFMVCPPPNPPKSAVDKIKKFLVIGMNRTPSETIQKAVGGEIHRKPVYFKVVEAPQGQELPEDIFGREVERKMRLDLEKTQELMRENGVVFDNNGAKGWIGELAACAWESFFGNPCSIITLNGKNYKPDEAVKQVWNPKAAGKGEESDLSIKEEKFSVSFDHQELTLFTHKTSLEVKNRPSDFKNSSQVSGENKSLASAEKAKHVKCKTASSEDVEISFGLTLVEKTKENVVVLSPHSDIAPKTASKESSIFFDQNSYTMNKESKAAMEEAAEILSTSSNDAQ